MAALTTAIVLAMLAPPRKLPFVPAYTMLPSRSAPALTMMAKNLVELKVYELKAVCKAKRLKVSGNKADLIRRIELSAQGIADAPRNGRRQSFADPAVARPQPPAAAPAAPARVPPASAPVVASISDASRAAPASSDAEVMSEAEGLRADSLAHAASKRLERRSKLHQYYSEEHARVYGELAGAAGLEYDRLLRVESVRLFDSPPVDLSVAMPAVQQHLATAALSGRRLAWCSRFDASLGTGVIVDLLQRTELRLDTSALSVSGRVPVGERALSVGEFVEYSVAAADAFDRGRPTRDGWVHGIQGWPLMCEARRQGAEELLKAR